MLVTGALYLHGLDDAIAGASDCGKLIYDYQKIVSIYEKEGMTQEEAIDFIDYNGAGFIMMYDKGLVDIEELSS